MRYFQELHIGVFNNETLIDQNGNYIRVEPKFEFSCFCRADANAAGKKVQDEDGSHIVYSFVIYAGKECPDISIGTLVKVIDGNREVCFSQVIYFVRNRKNCILWV